MPRPSVYKLEHAVAVESGHDSEIYFKTTMKDDKLVMLMKVWMYKIAEYVAEYEFYEEEMMEILETFGCKRISVHDNFNTYYSADMYEIWEAANIKPADEDMCNPSFINDEAEKVFLRVLKRNDTEFLEHALKDDRYKQYNQRSKEDFYSVAIRNNVYL